MARRRPAHDPQVPDEQRDLRQQQNGEDLAEQEGPGHVVPPAARSQPVDASISRMRGSSSARLTPVRAKRPTTTPRVTAPSPSSIATASDPTMATMSVGRTRGVTENTGTAVEQQGTAAGEKHAMT